MQPPIEEVGRIAKQPLMSDISTIQERFLNGLAPIIGKPANQGNAESETDEQAIARLSNLTPFEYDRVRKSEANLLGVRVESLDRIVEAHRPCEKQTPGVGQVLSLPDIKPWADSVDGDVLLTDLSEAICKYVSLPKKAADAIVLWVVWSYVIDHFDIAPRLAVLSPEKRCGKTTLLELIVSLAPRALLASGITPSAIFRTIERAKPTLLIDEADTFVSDNEELRGILNSGHTRAAARIIRNTGDDHEPRVFSTWCPMVVAAIGNLPDTVEDRSIVIPMQRKAPGDNVASFPRSGKRSAALKSELFTLARKAKRWADDHAAKFHEGEPVIPAGLNDRAADNWRPLLAIADEAGGAWPGRAEWQLSG